MYEIHQHIIIFIVLCDNTDCFSLVFSSLLRLCNKFTRLPPPLLIRVNVVFFLSMFIHHSDFNFELFPVIVI